MPQQTGARFDFTKGISAVVDPALMRDGFAAVVDNIDLSAIAAQSMRAPVFRMDPPAGTKDCFEYRGKWHFTTGRREWLADFVGRQERLYYKDVEPGVTDHRPRKVIDAMEALLGLQCPPVPPMVAENGYLSPKDVEATVLPDGGSLPAGQVTYRLGLRTELGLIPASAPVTVKVAENGRVSLKFSRVTYDKATKIVVYGRKSGEEQILEELNPTVTEWLDDGSLTPAGQFAKTLDESTVFHYFFTYVRDTNGHQDESGPSPIFGPLVTPQARVITRSVFFEGLFDNGTTWGSGEISTTATPVTTAIVGQKIQNDFKTTIVTQAAHGRISGDQVGIVHAHTGEAPTIRDQVYFVTVPMATLAKPVLTAFTMAGAEDVWEGTAWPHDVDLRVGVVAFRGAEWEDVEGGAPAETDLQLADTLTLVTSDIRGVVVRWSYPTGGHDGFHVYLNGFYIATVPKSQLYYCFGQVTPNATRPAPIVNSTVSRVLILPTDAKSIGWDESAAITAGRWGGVCVDPRTAVTMLAAKGYVPCEGDLLFFSTNTPELGGFTEVKDPSTSSWYIPILTESNHTLGVGQTLQVAGDHARFIKEWNLYVMRGDTGEFLLQGAYPLTQTEIIDATPVEELNKTCQSFYTETGAYGNPVIVSFASSPPDIRGLTLHQSMLWGIVDRTVRWTPINRPDAWPDAYQRTFEYEPLFLAPYAGTLLVMCTDGIYRLDGADPNSISRSKTLAEDGLIAPYSVQPSPAGLIYLSRRGLMAYRGDMNTSIPISEGKVPAEFFLAGSGAPDDPAFPFWAIPTRHGAAWAHLTKDYPAADPGRKERILSDVLPMDWQTHSIRSFVWRGKYHLYYADLDGAASAYRYHGMVVVDCTREGYPITLSGLRPISAHVTERERAFLLFRDPSEGEPG